MSKLFGKLVIQLYDMALLKATCNFLEVIKFLSWIIISSNSTWRGIWPLSLINLFILSYFGMMVNKEIIRVCVFLIYLMLFYGWVRYFYPIHKNRHYANMQQEH